MITTRTYSPLTILVIVVCMLAASTAALAQGTLTDSLVMRNAANGRTTLLSSPALVPAASWTLVTPSIAGPTGAMLYGTLAGSTTTLTWLPVGSNGDVLTIVGGLPSWSSAGGWLTTGNNIVASWNGVAGSFLGTTNAEDLVMNTNNVFRARLVGGAVNTGNFVLGTTTASPTNTLATDADDRLTVLGGDISLNSETNAAITRQILFRGTAGAGNFRIGADGGDIFWQGGGGQRLQEGSYWGIEIRGMRQTGVYPAFAAGAITDAHVNIVGEQNGVPMLVTTPTLTFTSNQQEWRSNAGTALSIVNASGNFGVGVITGLTSKLQINAATTTGNAIQLDPYGAAATNTGQIRFMELAANGTNYAALRSADNMANSNIYTLPSAVGGVGQVLGISAVAGNNATLGWTTANSILEEVTVASGNIRRKVAFTNGIVGTPGLYATDLMGARSAVSQTASGDYAGLLAGIGNTAGANYSAVVGGATNAVSGSYSIIGAGSLNAVSGQYGGVFSGSSNSVSGNYSVIVGGTSNTVSGNYSIVAGDNNSVSDNNNFVAGQDNVVTEEDNFVAGQDNTVNGEDNFVAAENSTIASGSENNLLAGDNNDLDGDYSVLLGRNNELTGNYSLVFGYGANVTQSNTIVFNHPSVSDGATRVGIDINNPQTSLDIDGGLTVRPATANTAITGNNQTVTPGNRTYIVLDPGGANRTGLILANGLQTGQILIFRILETAANYIQMPDAVANNVALTGNWVGRANDTITLIWSGVDWVELSRSNN